MSNNKNKLRSELKNLYCVTNKFLTNAEISDFVNKYTGNNSMNVKKQAYRKAYTKYMNYMATTFTQDMIKEIKAKMKSSPKCPSGVVGGGPSLGGTIRAVTGGMRAACGKSGQPNCSSVANRTRSKTYVNQN